MLLVRLSKDKATYGGEISYMITKTLPLKKSNGFDLLAPINLRNSNNNS